jgi:hypothetical protein
MLPEVLDVGQVCCFDMYLEYLDLLLVGGLLVGGFHRNDAYCHTKTSRKAIPLTNVGGV